MVEFDLTTDDEMEPEDEPDDKTKRFIPLEFCMKQAIVLYERKH